METLPVRERQGAPTRPQGTPQDSMIIADVSTGRRRDAGAAFRREMAARVDAGAVEADEGAGAGFGGADDGKPEA
jgi:hypothetical protein